MVAPQTIAQKHQFSDGREMFECCIWLLPYNLECAQCEEGTYNPLEAQASCKDCEAGTKGGECLAKV